MYFDRMINLIEPAQAAALESLMDALSILIGFLILWELERMMNFSGSEEVFAGACNPNLMVQDCRL